jgi:hypothetical protein
VVRRRRALGVGLVRQMAHTFALWRGTIAIGTIVGRGGLSECEQTHMRTWIGTRTCGGWDAHQESKDAFDA